MDVIEWDKRRARLDETNERDQRGKKTGKKQARLGIKVGGGEGIKNEALNSRKGVI